MLGSKQGQNPMDLDENQFGGWDLSNPPEKTEEDGQKIQNVHPKFPPESFGTLIDRCALKNWSYFWWSHADSMESNPVLSRKTLRKVLGCQRNPGPLMSKLGKEAKEQ